MPISGAALEKSRLGAGGRKLFSRKGMDLSPSSAPRRCGCFGKWLTSLSLGFLVYKMGMVIIVSIPEPLNLPSLLFVLS